ncbi:ABC transporter substrate-binding protein [Agarilytica rhodophyticola]|uniref:ABC transporter substrate-binding protein n=1 Tax=Agarilytica rhodophyticola TaxID=1737490 RepID=UPI0031832964
MLIGMQGYSYKHGLEKTMRRLGIVNNTCAYLIWLFCFICTSFVDAGEIKVGMSTALDGPAKALGQGVKLGVETYFNKVNASGGVNGNTLSLVAKNDGYEPKKAAVNMRELADNPDILAVIGNVGTPTAIVTVPIANEKKILLFGAFTGAGVLRKTPPERYVMNYRASYAEETSAMIEGLLKSGIKPEEIAFFTQNDGYGDAGYNGAIAALKKKGYADADSLAHGRYPRNSLNVEEGLSDILDADVEPRAIIMVGAYNPCATFIELAKEELPDTLFLNVSFVGSVPLLKKLGKHAENVIVTQVVPHYNDDHSGIKEYRQALKEFSPEAAPGFVSLEGYIAAKIFVEGLKKTQGKGNREDVINALQSIGTINLGIGSDISFSSTKHQGSNTVWPTIIKNGEYVPLQWEQL